MQRRKTVTYRSHRRLRYFLAIQLRYEPQVIIHCHNSRSRSPNVILAFMLLFRSMETHVAVLWLRHAFQQQRGDAQSNSAEFPNFTKFKTVLQFLEHKKVQMDPWLSQRILDVCKYYNEAVETHGKSSKMTC